MTSLEKITTLPQLKSDLANKRIEGKKIALCHGHYNVIHPGHLRFLQFAKQTADIVVVSVANSEELGPKSGSFFTQDERALGVSNLEVVDAVVKVENSVIDVIKDLKPEFYIKGKEFEDRPYLIEEEVKAVELNGGKVVFSSGEVKYTTTSLMNDSAGDPVDRVKSSFINTCLKHNIELASVKQKLSSFKDLNLLVIGDTIVDQFVACDPLGVSSEAPVMVVRELEQRQFIGGAAIIAQHVQQMGAKCHYLSVAGNDDIADFVDEGLTKSGVNSFIIRDPSRPTTFKIRYMAENQKLFRVSRLKQNLISKKHEEELLAKIAELIPSLNGIIISDFVYGVITNNIIEKVKEMASRHGVKIFGDTQCSSQVGDVSKFTGIDIITPTEREARISMADPSSGLEKLATNLLEKTGNKHVVITLGAQGLLVFTNPHKEEGSYLSEFFPALETNPKDVAGAGDAMLTGFALGYSAGFNILECAILGSSMSALSVMRLGNISLKREDVERYIGNLISYRENYIHDANA